MTLPLTGRDRLLGLLHHQTIDRPPLMPITMMLAADHIGVPYRQYVFDYRVLVEGQIRTAEAYGFDFVSGISDPTREAGDCGTQIRYFDNQPPAMEEDNALLANKGRLARLKVPDPLGGGRMHDRVQAMALFKQRIGEEKLIEGFIEGPCAQGADLRGINTLMLDFFDDGVFVRELFEFTTELEWRFAKAQVDAGADFIAIGDAAASLVAEIYREFVWPYQKKLVDRIHALGVPVRLHICGNTRPLLADLGRLRVEIIDLDYPVPVDEARAAMGPDQILLGNLHPVQILMNGTPGGVYEAVARCHQQAGERYIIGAGCEIPRGTPPENVRALFKYSVEHPFR